MQKKLIALALAGLAAAPAFAQSNVTVYGRVDYGYMSRGGDDGAVTTNGRKGEMASGMQAGSRIGFRGEEALGNGLKAIFEVESGITNDAPGTAAGQSGLFTTNRHSYVGLSHAKFGTVVGGRLDGVRYGVFNKYDPFAGGGMGNFTQMTTQVDRADNAVAYISPKWNGFGLVVAGGTSIFGQEFGTGSTVTGVNGTKANLGDSRLYTIMGTYDNGPLSVSLDYETIDERHIANDSRLYVVTAGASYDFKVVKIAALYDIIKGDENSAIGTGTREYDRRNWFVAASVPYGNFLFKANYGRVQNKEFSNSDASKFGLGVNYYLSKRTNVYVDYGRINNDSAATFQLSPAANSNGGGYGVSGFNVGLAHNF